MQEKYTVLVVDDEEDILDIVSYNLNQEGYRVYTADSGISGVKKAVEKRPDLILLDVMMPEMDGIEACEKIRNEAGLKDTLIAFLTARGEDYSQVAGFEAGADDYITKPIKPKVLMSRVKALLRRRPSDSSSTGSVISAAGIVIDLDQYNVTVNGAVMELPRKEFELLSLLLSKPGKVFTREAIMDAIWGRDVVVGGRTIDVHIRKLREKIGDANIKTIKGVGYKFEE